MGATLTLFLCVFCVVQSNKLYMTNPASFHVFKADNRKELIAMTLAEITAVLDEAVAEGSEYAFVLVKTHSNDESIIIPADKIADKKEFYEETFDAEGNHKTYPDIALLHATHGDADANITLRKEYYDGENEVETVE